MDYVVLLRQVIERVEAASALLAAEWLLPTGPRGSVDKAEVDLEIESCLRRDLLALLNCDFWGEETGHTLTGAEYCWVVDPNDGTSDFLKGHKGSAVSVGLLRSAAPVLGVVCAPVTEDRGADCIAWAEGLSSVLRNGQEVSWRLDDRDLEKGSKVMVSVAAAAKPEVNAALCAPADFVAMPSIAYRLARVAAGDGIAAVSLVPVSAHDVVAGHALLKGAGGALLNQEGHPVIYKTEADLAVVSQRCFGGAPAVCRQLALRDWSKVFK
ncbi:inositol monophosphatase family protein [Marinobacter sp.]|uniref:inositol monophosphatase family protein n=1 Tax=Marinobacter sp. TaxID=50741 RepID=UPI003A935DF4|tara:strand:+ start:6641 stop:7444 length:804 start_codon:yes stop_codon:yes gene_type:complete